MRFAVFADAECVAREATNLIAEKARTASAARARGVSHLQFSFTNPTDVSPAGSVRVALMESFIPYFIPDYPDLGQLSARDPHRTLRVRGRLTYCK